MAGQHTVLERIELCSVSSKLLEDVVGRDRVNCHCREDGNVREVLHGD